MAETINRQTSANDAFRFYPSNALPGESVVFTDSLVKQETGTPISGIDISVGKKPPASATEGGLYADNNQFDGGTPLGRVVYYKPQNEWVITPNEPTNPNSQIIFGTDGTGNPTIQSTTDGGATRRTYLPADSAQTLIFTANGF